MDARLYGTVGRKIAEVLDDAGRIRAIAGSVPAPTGDRLAYGIAIGRLYNSFHYQCRRILGRDPTDEEFSEFTALLGDHRDLGRI